MGGKKEQKSLSCFKKTHELLKITKYLSQAQHHSKGKRERKTLENGLNNTQSSKSKPQSRISLIAKPTQIKIKPVL